MKEDRTFSYIGLLIFPNISFFKGIGFKSFRPICMELKKKTNMLSE